MGNKDFWGCDVGWCADLPGKLCYEKLDKKNSENDYMIIPENFNKNLEQKRGPWAPPPPPPPPPQKKNQIWILCQIHLLELKKLLSYFEMLIVPHALMLYIV